MYSIERGVKLPTLHSPASVIERCTVVLCHRLGQLFYLSSTIEKWELRIAFGLFPADFVICIQLHSGGPRSRDPAQSGGMEGLTLGSECVRRFLEHEITALILNRNSRTVSR